TRDEVWTFGVVQGWFWSGNPMLATSGTRRNVSPFGSCNAAGAHRCSAPLGTQPSWLSEKIGPFGVQPRPSVEKKPSVFCIGYGLPEGPAMPMSCEVYMQYPCRPVSRSRHFMMNGSEALSMLANEPPMSATAGVDSTKVPTSTVVAAA